MDSPSSSESATTTRSCNSGQLKFHAKKMKCAIGRIWARIHESEVGGGSRSDLSAINQLGLDSDVPLLNWSTFSSYESYCPIRDTSPEALISSVFSHYISTHFLTCFIYYQIIAFYSTIK